MDTNLRMKSRGIFGVLMFCLLLFAFVPIPAKKLIGHWGTLKDMSFAGPGDTLNFEKKKYDPLFYTGLKYKSGIESTSDTLFKEYHNIGANAEEDNVFYHNEKYYFESDSVIQVKGYSRTLRYKILNVSSKKLSLKILPLN